MSGVFGFCSGAGRVDAERAATAMGARMRHLAHHAVEICAPAEALAIGRLHIGIFNAAPQPRRSPHGAVSLWLTGELYHQEARRAALAASQSCPLADDADLALAVYLREGADGLAALDGAFMICVWDGEAQELVLVNDRYGLYPHYYADTGDALAFAPEIKGVLAAPGVPLRLDLTAVAQYLRFQQLLGERTWAEDVRLFPPATIMRYRPAARQLTLTRYWDWDSIATQPRITFDEAVEECIRLFQRAIDEQTRPPQRVGVYLSGGLDSRIILGFIDRKIPVTTLTYGAPGCRDVTYAAELARRAGSDHHWLPLHDGRWVMEHADLHLALTEGLHSWIHGHGISMLAQARALIDVNLSGWDGATTMGGFAVLENHADDRYYRFPPSETDLAIRLYDGFCQHITWPGLTEPEAEALLGGGGERRLRGLAFDSLRDEIARTAHYPADRRVDYIIIQQYLRRALQNHLVLTRAAVEVRCPYFDYDFVTFMYSLPEHIRATPRLRRALLTRRMPHLATVPYDKTDLLPDNNPIRYHAHAALQRAKGWFNRHVAPVFPSQTRLYADYENYLRTDLRPWAECVLFDQRTQSRGLFDQAAVRALWQRHQSGAELWTIGKIAPLITLELVLRTFFD